MSKLGATPRTKKKREREREERKKEKNRPIGIQRNRKVSQFLSIAIESCTFMKIKTRRFACLRTVRGELILISEINKYRRIYYNVLFRTVFK